jgi:hypothetical protein
VGAGSVCYHYLRYCRSVLEMAMAMKKMAGKKVAEKKMAGKKPTAGKMGGKSKPKMGY